MVVLLKVVAVLALVMVEWDAALNGGVKVREYDQLASRKFTPFNLSVIHNILSSNECEYLHSSVWLCLVGKAKRKRASVQAVRCPGTRVEVQSIKIELSVALLRHIVNPSVHIHRSEAV